MERSEERRRWQEKEKLLPSSFQLSQQSVGTRAAGQHARIPE